VTTLTHPIEIRQVDRSQDQVLRNLLNLYLHDMAEWFLFDSNEDGTYTYETESLWQGGVDVHFAYHDRIPIGFALVGSAAEFLPTHHAKDLEEFFVVRRYRRAGVGTVLATHIWNTYPGPWLVRVYQRNRPALPFWRTAISAFSHQQYEEDERSISDRPWSYFIFDSADSAAG
jgi:predicted acetyltransferase